ncbi:MAG: AAA family ATPase [Planctomycetes bacterium]|jgi:hypothetical protein|nr:AAA family ATPase [Planctomycetota bacterium]
MITKLSITNFKSIRQLDLDCKKINLFFGEPNTGKSNILEALALLSYCGQPGDVPLGDLVRFQTMPNLFYDQLLDQEIEIQASISEASQPTLFLAITADISGIQFHTDRQYTSPREEGPPFRVVTYEGKVEQAAMISGVMAAIKFFRFKRLERYDSSESGGLKPPSGANLFSVVLSSRTLREIMVEFFRKYGLKLVLKPNERVFELQKQVDDLVFSYPYVLTSDTLQRIIFYTVAMTSNKDSVLVFEEPESNAFPYYTKYLGERIALDETNQFFIATHNPYLLSAIVEKGRKEDVEVFITYFKDYQTKIKPLTPEEVSELMEADPFFNLDRFVEDEE